MSEAARPLEDSPFFERTVLKRPEEFETPPSVALHLLTKNAESVIQRLLDNVGPYVSEVVGVLNDTDDDTLKILLSWGKEHGKRVDMTLVTAESHPDLYILDDRKTYEIGRSLCGEAFSDDIFTERPILADWSSIRNIAWERCTADWKLFLDSDDVVKDPESIWGICDAIGSSGADMALSKYHWNVDEEGRARGASYRERIAKNSPDIRWIYPIHEVLHGYTRHAFIDGNLNVIDRRDSRGAGIRIPGRNFKILYHYARSRDWEVSSRLLLQLAEAGRTMPDFVRRAIDIYLERSTWPEERGWAYCLKGETFEASGDFTSASDCYECSLIEHPGTKAAFRLCRSRYFQGRFKESVAAYKAGVEHMQVLQVLDDGPIYLEMSKILVADAYWRLGEKESALALAREARVSFPTTIALGQMVECLERGDEPPAWQPVGVSVPVEPMT